MNPLHNHLKKETENMRLTHEEKSVMRARIMQTIQPIAPVRTYVPIKSPYSWLITPRSFVFAAVAFLLIISTGTSYAAEGSLPGAPLYPVKTNILEPLAVALASGPAAKAQANANIATTRVKEAQTLAAQGQLTPAAAEEISNNYNAHATAALALAADIEGDTHASATSTAVVAVTTDTSATPSAQPADVPAVQTRDDSSALAATTTTDTGTDIVPIDVHPTALTFARVTISAEATTSDSSGDAATTTPLHVHTPGAKSGKNITATSTVTISAADSGENSSLLSQLHASLSVQAKILDRLSAEAHAHQ